MCNTAVGGDLGVYVAALALIQVDLRLENVDFLGLHFEFLFEVLLQLLHLALLLVVFVHKDGLVGGVQLAVEFELLLAQRADQVEQVGVLLDALGQVALRLLEVAFLFLDVADALLFGLVELVLLIENGL